ncbi:hypothetical protein [Actinokineospora sp. NBRC 105648]|uniref:hypothetical protein n=1 Tax=Actinokineospora sp. NBRC 105648 TaxID=3032206 RepID=UPI0024A0DC5C|nr:hypothetical protein [Actinokineospora sp. NBRC 105648]GLZ43520.1 hypothetical protein Acsp05_71440 [Actinokineospora sp. NBRC 105648]
MSTHDTTAAGEDDNLGDDVSDVAARGLAQFEQLLLNQPPTPPQDAVAARTRCLYMLRELRDSGRPIVTAADISPFWLGRSRSWVAAELDRLADEGVLVRLDDAGRYAVPYDDGHYTLPGLDGHYTLPGLDQAQAEAEQVDGRQDVEDQARVEDVPGETERVRRLRAQLAEARLTKDLEADLLALDRDTERVLERRRRAQEAAKLDVLDKDPATRAFHARRALVRFTAAGLLALTLALLWSTFNVQVFAAADAPVWSARWVMAWLVEPFLSLSLLTVVGTKAYIAVRSLRPVQSRTLDRIEWTFLALTLGMQLIPVLPPPIGTAAGWSVPDIALHVLGPIVAVASVRALPIIWAEFGRLDHSIHSLTGDPHPALYSENTDSQTAGLSDYIDTLTARARELIERGTLTGNPSGRQLRKTLGCGSTQAGRVRDRLAEGEA